MAGRAEATFRLAHADGSWRSLGALAAPLAEADEGATSLRCCAPCGASTDRVFHFAPPLAPPDAEALIAKSPAGEPEFKLVYEDLR